MPTRFAAHALSMSTSSHRKRRRAYLSATSSKSKAFFGSAGTILKT